MDIRKIKTLIEMLEESNLNEIEVSQGDESVRISKGNDTKNLIESDQLNTNISNHESLSMNKDNKENLNGHQVKAPLVGTFYRKPSPESDPFIKVGDVVKKGELIGYVGNTGKSTGPHLHWSLTLNAVYVDPMIFVNNSLFD